MELFTKLYSIKNGKLIRPSGQMYTQKNAGLF